MRGDYSKRIFSLRNPYADVHMQQGRVQLDVDWNEHEQPYLPDAPPLPGMDSISSTSTSGSAR
jgi:hypothetical protein